MIGETVGSFKIISKLSVGGMGTVYRAEHTLIGKLAAVKVLHKELSANREIITRFFNEAKATTAIKHPGIVDVYDYGYMASGDAYLIMEFLEGMSLARHLKTKGRMSEGEAAMLLRAVCSALAAAHAKGIVHRDLKPDNIYMCTDTDSPTGDRPKVLDFGIAKLTDIGLAGTATKTGAVMGTPTYMSPEQCKGTGDVDHRADLYSIGCIFYELVVGRPPFTKLGAGELIGAHIYAMPEPPTKYNPAITKDTEKLIMSLLQKRPEKRPQSAKELAQRLSQLAQNLGWITVASPDGVTARGLRDLSSGPVMIPPTDQERLAKTVLPDLPESSTATTPYGLEASMNGLEGFGGEDPSIFIDNNHANEVGQPTTLSGAASQSVVSVHGLPRRSSRKGVVIAMLSAALIGGAAVVVVKVTNHNDGKVAASPPVIKVDPPTIDPTPPPAMPTPPAHVDPTPPATHVDPVVDPPKDPTVATPPPKKPPPRKLPPKLIPKVNPPADKPVEVKPVEPDKAPCAQPPCLDRRPL